MMCPVCHGHLGPNPIRVLPRPPRPAGFVSADRRPGPGPKAIEVCSNACYTAWKTGFARNRIEAQR